MDRKNAHDPRGIANYILDICDKAEEKISIMQLIKLIYMADGWTMSFTGKPLVNERPQAWQYGPVYRRAYNAFSGNGSSPVASRAMASFSQSLPIAADMLEEERKIVDMVVKSYGKLSAYNLSELTHQDNTPWSKAYQIGAYHPLSDSDMKEHFDSLREKRLVKK